MSELDCYTYIVGDLVRLVDLLLEDQEEHILYGSSSFFGEIALAVVALRNFRLEIIAAESTIIRSDEFLHTLYIKMRLSNEIRTDNSSNLPIKAAEI